MQIVKSIGLLLVGVGIGTLTATQIANLAAEAPNQRLIPDQRLIWDRGGTLHLDNHALRFIRDTRTKSCYLASLSRHADPTIVAIAPAPTDACD